MPFSCDEAILTFTIKTVGRYTFFVFGANIVVTLAFDAKFTIAKEPLITSAAKTAFCIHTTGVVVATRTIVQTFVACSFPTTGPTVTDFTVPVFRSNNGTQHFNQQKFSSGNMDP